LATDGDSLAAIWRIESARVIACVARMVRDVGVAEEIAQDALVAALEHWPREGMPRNPGAWLTVAAKRRALDHLRHQKMQAEKLEAWGLDLEAQEALIVPDFVDALDAARQDDIGDDLLTLVFTACHPVLSPEARVALTLKLLGGLSTQEIAPAFLVPEATIAQRIVRAKKALADAKVPYEVPRGEALSTRLASVLEVVYLIFNEGYTATSGGDWMRPALVEEALRLGRILVALAPAEPEAHGLLALMELQASRMRARTDPEGRPILLAAQDRGRWDHLLIRRGLSALARGETLAREPGPYLLQAAIAACHARAGDVASTDWARIARLYEALARVMPSPVVQLNRAVAVSMAEGPAAGLAIVDSLVTDKSLRHYQWLPSVRADLLEKLGRREEAKAEFLRAAGMAMNEREKAYLLERAEAAER